MHATFLTFFALTAGLCAATSQDPGISHGGVTPPRPIFGLGVYNDTPGSPAVSAQLPLVANLTGPGGWALIFVRSFSALGPPDGQPVNVVPAAWEVGAINQAYALGLRPVVRIGASEHLCRCAPLRAGVAAWKHGPLQRP